MKEKLKKICLMAATFVAVVGMLISVNSNNTYAASDKSVRIHYLREDGNYKDYKICIWDEFTQGTDYEFTVDDNEATVTYNCSSKDATVVVFVLKESNGAKKDIVANRQIDVSEINSGTINVYVKAGVEGYSLDGFGKVEPTTSVVSTETTIATPEETTTALPEETTTAVPEETTANSTEETTVVSQETTTVAEATQVESASGEKKDYSVSTVTIIIADIVAIILMAGISYAVCNKKEEK